MPLNTIIMTATAMNTGLFDISLTMFTVRVELVAFIVWWFVDAWRAAFIRGAKVYWVRGGPWPKVCQGHEPEACAKGMGQRHVPRVFAKGMCQGH